MVSFREGARGRAGFTVFELLIVLGLVMITSSLAIHAWFSRSEVTLENAARLLASDLHAAQARAIVRHEPVEFVFHSDGGGYHVTDLAPEQDPAARRRYPVDAVFEDVRIRAVRLQNGRTLGFDRSGRPSSGGTITLEQNGVTHTLVIDALDGMVYVEGER